MLDARPLTDAECRARLLELLGERERLKDALAVANKARDRLERDLDGAIDLMKHQNIPLPEHWKSLGAVMKLELEKAELAKEVLALRALLARAAEALGPFADDAAGIDWQWDDRRRRDTLTGIMFTVGDCRQAAATRQAVREGLQAP